MNCGECHLVGEVFSQEDAPQTHQSVCEITRNTGIRQLPFGGIIRDLIRATHPVVKVRGLGGLSPAAPILAPLL